MRAFALPQGTTRCPKTVYAANQLHPKPASTSRPTPFHAGATTTLGAGRPLRVRQARAKQLAIRAAVAEPPVLEKEVTFPRGAQWEVHKFGGTCVASPDRIRDVAQLMLKGDSQRVTVVSAMGSHPASPVKVTDLLLNMVDKAAKQDEAFLLDLAALQQKHLDAAKALLGSGDELNTFVGTLLNDIANLKAMLHAISIGMG